VSPFVSSVVAGVFSSSVIAFHSCLWGFRAGLIPPAALCARCFVSDKRADFFADVPGGQRHVSAKFNWMLERELTGLRYSYEEAGPIIEDLDPFGWGGTCQ
jgi:hypothetical protein